MRHGLAAGAVASPQRQRRTLQPLRANRDSRPRDRPACARVRPTAHATTGPSAAQRLANAGGQRRERQVRESEPRASVRSHLEPLRLGHAPHCVERTRHDTHTTIPHNGARSRGDGAGHCAEHQRCIDVMRCEQLHHCAEQTRRCGNAVCRAAGVGVACQAASRGGR